MQLLRKIRRLNKNSLQRLLRGVLKTNQWKGGICIVNSVQAITFSEPTAPVQTKASGKSFKDYQNEAMKGMQTDATNAAPDDKAQTAGLNDDKAAAQDTPGANINQAVNMEDQAVSNENVMTPEDIANALNTNQNDSQVPSVQVIITMGQQTQKTDAESTEDSKNTEQDAKEKKNEVSICCDSKINELLNGIVSILEGFGLLNDKPGNNVLPQNLKEMIGKAIQDAQNTVVTDDTVVATQADQVLPETNARMPHLGQTMKAVQSEIKSLVEEYLCSFANVNKKGANEKGSAEPVNDTGIKAEDNPKNILDKLLQMVQEAYAKSNDVKVQPKVTGAQNVEVQEPAPKEANTAGLEGPLQKPAEVQTANVEAPLKEAPTQKVMQDNLSQIVQKMKVSLEEGKQQFEVALKPDSLGKLNIKIIMDSDGLKAHIKASDDSVKGLITEQLPMLQEALKEKGVTVVHIDVSYERPDFNSQQSRQHNGQNNNHKKGANFTVSDIGSVTYDMMSDASELYAKNSSVEFQA